MSQLDTERALNDNLINNLPSLITINDVAFENFSVDGKAFKPANKDTWIACYFRPATSDAMSKDDDSTEEDRGFFQVSMFSKLLSPTGNRDLLTLTDGIKSAFKQNRKLVYNGQTVELLNSTTSEGSESDAYYQRIISINYMTFTSRG